MMYKFLLCSVLPFPNSGKQTRMVHSLVGSSVLMLLATILEVHFPGHHSHVACFSRH